MAVLLDTNILLRLLQPQHPHAAIAEHALEILGRRNEALSVTVQNLVEFWTVVTRPINENGLGFSPSEAMEEIRAIKQLFILLPEVPLHEEWERLVVTYSVSGKNTHDARLVAAMIVHEVNAILTFNMQDFTRYPISVLNPVDIARLGH